MCLNCQMTTRTRYKLAFCYIVMALVCVAEYATRGRLKLCERWASFYSEMESK